MVAANFRPDTRLGPEVHLSVFVGRKGFFAKESKHKGAQESRRNTDDAGVFQLEWRVCTQRPVEADNNQEQRGNQSTSYPADRTCRVKAFPEKSEQDYRQVGRGCHGEGQG